MKKRGQVTVFIIVGVVILIAVISYFAVNEFFLKDKFQSALEKNKNVPQQILPINNLLDSCTKDLALQGVNLLGSQGGYINLPNTNFRTTIFNPLGKTLEIIPNTNLKTSVWFREESNGIQSTNAPTKASMEKGLEEYIKLNYQTCLNGLDQFNEQGFSFIISGDPKPKVTIRDAKIDVSVILPIRVIKESLNFNLEEHLAQLDSRLGELHTMALDIVNKENKDFFLEKKTIDLLVAYDSEVPFSGSSTSCEERTWSKTAVIQRFKEILSENVAAFRIKGTNYELQNEKYNYLVFDALADNHKDITANMLYSPNFPTTVEINPSEGDKLKEDSINKETLPGAASIASAFFCLTNHRFIYTIKYPILITLTDSEGYVFQFATQILIERNEPRKNRVELVDIPGTDSALCKYPQQEITFETYTLKPTGDLKPLTDANIYLKCSPVSCPLEVKQVSGNRYTAFVPACVNGVLEAKKEGYYNAKVTEVSTNEEIKDTIPLVLIPFYTKNVKVYIIDKTTGEVRAPYGSEQIIFQFTHKLREAPYAASFIYPSEDNKIQLIPGEYSITSYVMGNSTWPITTPKQKTEHCFKTGAVFGLFGGEEKCVSVEIPETKMYSAMKGGANFDFEFTLEGLAKNSDLVLYTMASPIPGDAEGMAKINQEIDINKDNPMFKYPEL